MGLQSYFQIHLDISHKPTIIIFRYQGFKILAYFLVGTTAATNEGKIGQNFKALISENDYCGFVGNVEVDLELTFYTHKPLFDPSRAYLNFEIGQF